MNTIPITTKQLANLVKADNHGIRKLAEELVSHDLLEPLVKFLIRHGRMLPGTLDYDTISDEDDAWCAQCEAEEDATDYIDEEGDDEG